jgi:hypothetical protein
MILHWQPEHLGDEMGEETQVTVTLPKWKESVMIVTRRDIGKKTIGARVVERKDKVQRILADEMGKRIRVKM